MLAQTTRAGAPKIRTLWHPGAVARVIGAAATVLAAAGCGSSGLGGSSSSASKGSPIANANAPSCLPTTLDHSARLAGVPVDVSPAPGTGSANPGTRISFLGVPVTEIHGVSVVAQSSGHHSGRLEGYTQGDGASFVPDTPFRPGEQVVVRAVIGSSAGGKRIVFAFSVATPYSTAAVGAFPNPAAAPADYQSFHSLPGVQAPILTITAPDRDPAAGDIFVSNGPGPGRYGPLIYSPQGQLLWFDQLSNGVTADDLSVQSYNGQRDLTWWKGHVLALGFGQGEDIVMNSQYQTVATVKGGNGLQADLHDFQIAPHGIAYITAYNPLRCDLSSVGGPRNGTMLDTAVQQIDMKTGLVRWEWHSLDHVGVTESETSPPSSSAWDWFHLNSIDPQPDGNVLISARNTWASYQLQGGTGTILWRLGGLKSSFAMGPGTKTAWQHDGRMLPNGDITLFDDGSDPRMEYQSRAVRIALDFKTHRASLASAYTHPNPPLLATSQGNMQTLTNGNAVVGYGGVPEISEYAKDRALLFDAHLPFEMIFYRAFRFPWSGRPLSRPTLAASLNNVGETVVHMSWNGATNVDSWRVLDGKHSGSLVTLTAIPATGFESSATLLENYTYVVVQALDSAGHVLGTSARETVKSYATSVPGGRR
jgi:Arylsulfotransferase (ASST)